MRDYQKLKTLEDYRHLDEPQLIAGIQRDVFCSHPNLMVLRMLVRPKYGSWVVPPELGWLTGALDELATFDRLFTGIKDSWCYITVRSGIPSTVTDDEWHFDGSSFRVELIPERNYVWCDHTPLQYKVGNLEIPKNFDPNRYNLFKFAAKELFYHGIRTVDAKKWYLLNPFVLHRRDPATPTTKQRTFVRVCFTDVEGRDVNNTSNPLLPTPAFGRDPVKSFRDKLGDYPRGE